MSKKKTPWYNQTNNHEWDGYYLIVTPACIAALGFALLVVGAAVFNTFIAGKS